MFPQVWTVDLQDPWGRSHAQYTHSLGSVSVGGVMCGIIGYAGSLQAADVLIEGLGTLEYRGYDSAGIAVVGTDGLSRVHKRTGKLSNLKESLNGAMPEGSLGIGHTRWATHGGPTDQNAHPHADCSGQVAVVHNGIVENYQTLRRELVATGHVFKSQTDSECIPHIIEDCLAHGLRLEEAVVNVAQRIRGANAVVAFSTRDPGKIVGLRLGNAGGIVAGQNDDGVFLSSDLPALLPHTRSVIYLSAGEMVVLNGNGMAFTSVDGKPLEKRATHISYDALSASKGEHQHFMHKEIHEQPDAIVNALGGRVSFDDLSVNLSELNLSDKLVESIDRVVFLGMGTSLHAAMLGRHWMETLARIPCEYDNSSEFRYRSPVLDSRTLVVSVCQSGETVDTLAAMELARDLGSPQITLCNYPGTQTTQIADYTMLLRAGLEIGVAASKTFTSSLVSLLLLSLEFGIRRGLVGDERRQAIVSEIARLPDTIGSMLTDESIYRDIARKYGRRSDFLFLGRGVGFPLAMEGALKLKEISYIHAEGYPAGEMKHGPISLIDEDMPVVAIAPRDSLWDKMQSNISEVQARGGNIIAVASEGDTETANLADDVITIPRASEMLNPFLISVPMQLIAYHMGVRRGCDIDQPRNLAKTVTVE